MRASVIRHNMRVDRIIHHYFYPRGSTMVRYPRYGFWKRGGGACGEARSNLARVLLAERGRIRQWDRGTPDLLPVKIPGVWSLSADREPLKPGDSVMSGLQPCTVRHLYPSGVRVEFENGRTAIVPAGRLVHRPVQPAAV